MSNSWGQRLTNFFSFSASLPQEFTSVYSRFQGVAFSSLLVSYHAFFVCRDVSALAAAEMQRRLAAGLMGLRRGLSAARSLHSSLRSEATALESFIPVIVEGARSGMHQALQNQVFLVLNIATKWNSLPTNDRCHKMS